MDIVDSYKNIEQGKKPSIDPAIFTDKIVVFGANVIGGESLNDNKNSPIISKHPGADIQATSIDNILHNDFLTVIPSWANILITILGMLLIYFIVKISKSLQSIFGVFLLTFIYFVICCTCFYNLVIINVITPLVMFTLITIIAYMNQYSIENKNKEKVKSIMGKYMSEDVMKDVIKNIDNLGLGGKKAEVTVLFADIRGFTSLSEKMTAQEVSELLNEYFSEMEPIITSYNGIINKFIGDAVMAIFGEPIQDENHAQNAVKCGFEMLEKVKELHSKWEKEGKPLIEIGVGVNTGEVFVGNIGSVNRMEYTVIGDTVNLASRLESYNKIYKTKMLISSSTYEKVKDISETNLIPDVEIRGKAEKMNIYEVINIS
ncbi:MAG: CHASE2 domain-containing protein [bacterium]|nr:CHASE2 domain-containing protein [bacterium]